MIITLERFAYHPEGTMGIIKHEGETFYTIERPWMNNEPYISCIPEGEYKMGWRQSPRFGETWHIKDVPDRTHILIHAGNYPVNFHGCVGLGTALMGDRVAVANSKLAVSAFEKLTKDREWSIQIAFANHAALQS